MLRFVTRFSAPANSVVTESREIHPHVLHDQTWPRVLMPLLGGLLLILTSVNQPRASELGPHDILIPADDGYGTSECLAQQTTCGKAIADAWCRSHGHNYAIAYSRAEEITGVIAINANPNMIPPDSVVVRCGI